MNIDKALNSRVGGYIALACVAAAAVWYMKKKVGAAVDSVNPFTKGGALYNNVHNDDGGVSLWGVATLANPAALAYNRIEDAYRENMDAGNFKGIEDYFNSLKMPVLNFAENFNPASDKNLVYRGVTKVAGEENLAKAGDYIFGAIDLINPFNDDDTYAKSVWGIGSSSEDSRVINNNVKEGIK